MTLDVSTCSGYFIAGVSVYLLPQGSDSAFTILWTSKKRCRLSMICITIWYWMFFTVSLSLAVSLFLLSSAGMENTLVKSSWSVGLSKRKSPRTQVRTFIIIIELSQCFHDFRHFYCCCW